MFTPTQYVLSFTFFFRTITYEMFASTKISIENASLDSSPKRFWLISFLNSGTSFTAKMIIQTCFREFYIQFRKKQLFVTWDVHTHVGSTCARVGTRKFVSLSLQSFCNTHNFRRICDQEFELRFPLKCLSGEHLNG
jgi:hypothetical protein